MGLSPSIDNENLHEMKRSSILPEGFASLIILSNVTTKFVPCISLGNCDNSIDGLLRRCLTCRVRSCLFLLHS